MYHYTYIITNLLDSRQYIGVRSCLSLPDEDISYMSSSRYLLEDIRSVGLSNFSKKVIQIFDDRESAMKHEINLHKEFNVAESNNFYNKANATSTGFKRTGPHTQDTIDKIKSKRAKQVITANQIEKFKETWSNKSDKEMHEYSEFRKEIWDSKTEEEKKEFSEKMSDVNKEKWKNVSEFQKRKIVEKILKTKEDKTPEEKQQEFEKRSFSQLKAKESRTTEQIRKSVNKRKHTYSNMSEEQKKTISQRQSASMKGRKWYNNGEISKMFFENEEPENFVKGRKLC